MNGSGRITLRNRRFLREYSKLKASTIIPSAVQPEFSSIHSDTDELLPQTQPPDLTPTEQTGSTHPTELNTQADPPCSSMPRALKRLASHNKPGFCVISNQISRPFCMTVNDSFWTGIFPNKLKIAKVIILYKKDSKDTPTNYRSISLLSVFSTLIEKIMYKRLYSFLDSCSILHPLQFGFREKHSTHHALIGMTEKLKKELVRVCFGVLYLLIYRRHLVQSTTRTLRYKRSWAGLVFILFV